ncbi:MAG: sulfatase [Actinomycetota bacterium]|nr:sulfatase [Actinomycetota bacterium]
MRPNVLFVVLDTARADAFEPYGVAPGSTPTIAQLASSGRAIERAYATACWTLPSHASMFSGLMPRAAGLASPNAEGRDPRAVLHAHESRLLPAVLRDAGYETRAVSTNLWVSAANGFDAGFDEFISVDSGRQGKLQASGWGERANWAREALVARVDDGATKAEQLLSGWIAERDANQPSFWFVNLVECHSPYLPPRPYNDLGPLERFRAAEDARQYLNMGAIWQACLGALVVPDGALELMRHLYGRSITLMDDWLARILTRLDEARALDQTLVIVTSDHGENLGENGLMAHAFSLDDRLVRVPLVVSGPGSERFRDRLTSLAELPARIAAAIGLSSHPWNDDLPRGAAVAQFNPPVRADDPRVVTARADWDLDESAWARLTTRFDAATDGALKLVQRDGSAELYDLRSDPLEASPLPVAAANGKDASRVELLRRALDSAAAQAELGDLGLQDADVAADKPRDDAETQMIEEQMRLLGYL